MEIAIHIFLVNRTGLDILKVWCLYLYVLHVVTSGIKCTDALMNVLSIDSLETVF